MAPGLVEDHVANGDAPVAPSSDKAINGTSGEKKLAVAATNGTSEQATSTTASTSGHSHVPDGQHQRCCCCCQLRSKGAVEDKTESPHETSADDNKVEKEDEKDKKDGDADKKDGEDQTMKCEIKHLDRKYDDKDERYFVEAGRSPPPLPFGRTADCSLPAQG